MCTNNINKGNSVLVEVKFYLDNNNVLLNAYRHGNLSDYVDVIKVVYNDAEIILTAKDFNTFLDVNTEICNVFSENSLHTEMLFDILNKDKYYILRDVSLMRNTLHKEGFNFVLKRLNEISLTPLRVYESILRSTLNKYKEGQFGNYELLKLSDSFKFMNTVRKFYDMREVI